MERVSRRHLLAAGGSAALASAVVGSGIASAQGTRPPGGALTDWVERYALVVDPTSQKSARTAPTGGGSPTGPVYFVGSMYKDSDVSGAAVSSSASPVGRFRVAGWVYGGGANPQTIGIGSLDLPTRGKITLAGASGNVGSLAISGGTGEFQGVGGEARLANLGTGATALIIELSILPNTPGR